MTKPNFEETVKKIRDWLTEVGAFRCQMPDDNAHAHFQIEFPPGSSRLAEVIFPKPREDIVLIASGTALNKIHYDRLKAKSDRERKEILWNMRFELLFRGSDFRMIPGEEDLQSIQFIRPLRFEGLTNNLFMDAIREDFRCHLYVVWTMMRLFGEAPPKSSDTMYG